MIENILQTNISTLDNSELNLDIIFSLKCRFDGKEFMRRLKGKKMMFVGDSLSLNQWQSLTCMLHASLPDSNFTIQRKGDLSMFILPVINNYVEFTFF